MIRSLTIPISAGSEPDIADAIEAVGGEMDGEAFNFCRKSPNGQCQFTDADDHRLCIYCKHEDSF